MFARCPAQAVAVGIQDGSIAVVRPSQIDHAGAGVIAEIEGRYCGSSSTGPYQYGIVLTACARVARIRATFEETGDVFDLALVVVFPGAKGIRLVVPHSELGFV